MNRHEVLVGLTVYRSPDGRRGTVEAKTPLYGNWKYVFRVRWSDGTASDETAPNLRLRPVSRKKTRARK